VAWQDDTAATRCSRYAAATSTVATRRIIRPGRSGLGGGSTPNLISRLIGQWLSEHLGQPFVVESRTGDGGNIATQAVVSAAPDGYTLLTIVTTNAINVTLYEKLDFDFLHDIVPIAGVFRLPMVLMVVSRLRLKYRPQLNPAYRVCSLNKCSVCLLRRGRQSRLSLRSTKPIIAPWRTRPIANRWWMRQ
jgi:tripartite-type tricarboxylate transporter receptor subunit TctC